MINNSRYLFKLVPLVLLIALFGISCSNQDNASNSNPLLGKWKTSTSVLEFFDNGTVVVSSENGNSEATYSFVDDSHIQLNLNSESAILEYQISGEKLLLVDGQSTFELSKVSNSLFDNPIIVALGYIFIVWLFFDIIRRLYRLFRLQVGRQAEKFELAYVEFNPIKCHANKLRITKLNAHVEIQPHDEDHFEINISGSRGMCKRIQTSCKEGVVSVFEVLIDQDMHLSKLEGRIISLRDIYEFDPATVSILAPKGAELEVSGVVGNLNIGDV
jgi:hypothetical protein